MDKVLNYCNYEDFLEDGKDYYIVKIPFEESEYLYNIILSFGNKCECLEPLHIRNEIKRRINEIATLYEK